MSFHVLFLRRLAWVNVPGALLIALLQRTPALRLMSGAGELAVASPAGSILRSAWAGAAALGAMHTLAGATQFVQSPASPVGATVGSPVQVGFTYTGTPSAPASFRITSGSLPPGLSFIPAPVNSVVRSGTPVISGVPTQAGSFTVFVQGYNAVNGTGDTDNIRRPITFTITAATVSAPVVTQQPSAQTVSAGAPASFTVAASDNAASIQWKHNGADIPGATSATYTIGSVQPAHAGVYQATITNAAGSATSQFAILGVRSSAKLIGQGQEFSDITHPVTQFVYDQILLQSAAATVTADPGQILRVSFVDTTDDIVQLEFSGAGALTIVLDDVSGPALPVKYNQSIAYLKGHATLVMVDADHTTNLSVFSVGRITAVNQALFKEGVAHGQADVAFLSIASNDGRFAGLRGANANYFNTRGLTGVHAPGIAFDGPFFVGDINAFATATPVLMFAAAGDARITGGDLLQDNGRAIQVGSLTPLKFMDGSTSDGMLLPARANQGQFEQNGANVTASVVLNP